MERIADMVKESRLNELAAKYFPVNPPKPLRKDWTGLKEVVVVEHDSMPEWFHEQMVATAINSQRLMRHVKLPPKAEAGSIHTDGEMINGLNYWVCGGEELQAGNVFPYDGAQCVMDCIEEMTRINVRDLTAVRERVNVNLVINGQGGYEWHYDHNPLTAVYYVTDHDEDGEFMYVDKNGDPNAIRAKAGRLVFGDLSQRPHAVAPLSKTPIRLCVVFGFGVPGCVDDDEKVSPYLHGKGQ